LKPIFKALLEPVATSSSELAAALGLPSQGASKPRLVIGRREWVSLTDLGVSSLNAKIDSGARSSSIHAENLALSADEKQVHFTTTNHFGHIVYCHAAVVRVGHVRSSTGIARKRIFIHTTAMVAGGFRWTILVSLANRTEMHCPMLLGRRALAGFFLIDPQANHLLGTRRSLENL